MKEVLADTWYFLALLVSNDKGHRAAIAASESLAARLVTTAWVLVEVADAMADPVNRTKCAAFMQDLERDPKCVIVPASRQSFQTGLELYRARPEQEWSLTDCISFTVMNERGITEALTGDRHFEQAGFAALLK